jgi:hypothetical protein
MTSVSAAIRNAVLLLQLLPCLVLCAESAASKMLCSVPFSLQACLHSYAVTLALQLLADPIKQQLPILLCLAELPPHLAQCLFAAAAHCGQPPSRETKVLQERSSLT